MGSGEVPGTLAPRLEALHRQLPPPARLLAVSKGQPAEAIREAVIAGQRSFAESRLQEAVAKQQQLADLGPLDWHFIGRLQANKARGVLRHFHTIHSVDSQELAERLQRIAAEEQRSTGILFQVKFLPDPGKTGFAPDALRRAWPRLAELAPLSPLGLMTIAPLGLEREHRLQVFQLCRDLAAELGLTELSMGMSGDWPEAVAAGSTWVRLGTSLFGTRSAAMGPEGRKPG
jgi:pyridoxal phosphate enzyme (YggS family)